jgi:hypothetical protein
MQQPIFAKSTHAVLPANFRPLFWSYRFADLDPQTDKKTIIVQLINYGTLEHWRWLVWEYGPQEIQRTLESVPDTEIKTRTRKLASLIFSITNWRHAQRGTY